MKDPARTNFLHQTQLHLLPTLVIIRGNSGNGKTTAARETRRRFGRGAALLEQDHLRRTVLREHDSAHIDPVAPAFITTTARTALDLGYHVILRRHPAHRTLRHGPARARRQPSRAGRGLLPGRVLRRDRSPPPRPRRAHPRHRGRDAPVVHPTATCSTFSTKPSSPRPAPSSRRSPRSWTPAASPRRPRRHPAPGAAGTAPANRPDDRRGGGSLNTALRVYAEQRGAPATGQLLCHGGSARDRPSGNRQVRGGRVVRYGRCDEAP
jgi:hypothetical protein